MRKGNGKTGGHIDLESFNVKGNTCAGNIPLGGECEITVEFTGPEGEALIHFPPARSAILK